MFRMCVAFAAAVVLSLAAGDTGSARQKASGTATADQFQKALTVAQGQIAGGQLIKGRMEENGKVYAFYFWKAGKVYEIEITAIDLKVVKNVTNDNPSDVSQDVVTMINQKRAAKVKLPDGRLLEIASTNLKDAKISDLKYVKDGDRLLLQVGDKYFDATTGNPVTK